MKRALGILALMSCAACAGNAAEPSRHAAPPSVDARKVLAQIDRDIATLEQARSGSLSDAGLTIARGSDAIHAQLSNAAAHARGVRVTPPGTRRAEPAISQNVPVESAIAQYRQALQLRTQRALALREAQMREKESTVAYQFDRAHAGERLRLQLRLHTLHLTPSDRRALQSRLVALDSQDNAAVAAQRNVDQATLSSFEVTLDREASRQLTSLRRDLQLRASALRSIPQPNAAVVARAEAVPSRGSSLQNAAAFEQADRDLHTRFSQLHDWNALDARTLVQELTSLRAERARLVAEMQSAPPKSR